MVAEIVNSTHANALKTLNAFESDITQSNKGTLSTDTSIRQMMNKLRIALPHTQITSYTYKKLVGISSITDPRGQTVYYHYDDFNRLEFVKDDSGNILTNNQYNYKN
jgi:YD repeat-containing protein